MMADFGIEVMLQFPAMSYPYRVEVSPRQLHFLDTCTERCFTPEGQVVYRVKGPVWSMEALRAERAADDASREAA